MFIISFQPIDQYTVFGYSFTDLSTSLRWALFRVLFLWNDFISSFLVNFSLVFCKFVGRITMWSFSASNQSRYSFQGLFHIGDENLLHRQQHLESAFWRLIFFYILCLLFQMFATSFILLWHMFSIFFDCFFFLRLFHYILVLFV